MRSVRVAAALEIEDIAAGAVDAVLADGVPFAGVPSRLQPASATSKAVTSTVALARSVEWALEGMRSLSLGWKRNEASNRERAHRLSRRARRPALWCKPCVASTLDTRGSVRAESSPRCAFGFVEASACS